MNSEDMETVIDIYSRLSVLEDNVERLKNLEDNVKRLERELIILIAEFSKK